MKLESEILVKLLRDPVMAAELLTGLRLDTFQAARLRYLWFVPDKVDESGWSTGKTICEWIYAVLRASLIPDHVVGVYYPVFQTGKDEFWKYFGECSTPLLFDQYAEGKHDHREAGCWRLDFKNGSKMLLPAPGFMKDAKNQASRRFNTLIIGEYTQSAMDGEGVDELLGRNSRQSWNQNHPVWSNHTLLSAHAEPPGHPARKYVKAKKDAIAGKYTAREACQNAVISFCYLDWSNNPIDPEKPDVTYRKRFRDEKAINQSKRSLSRSQFRCRLLGVSAGDDRGWYPESVCEKLLSAEFLPLQARPPGCQALYVMGGDAAPGQGNKADSCFIEVWRILQVAPSANWTWFDGAKYWRVGPCYAHTFKNVSSRQYAGLIHGLHMRFAFSRVVLDPGGGGAWVYKDLMEREQIIENAKVQVTPLCTRDEPLQADKQPIVIMFKRGSELDTLWAPHFLRSDEGLIEAAHRAHRESIEAREYAIPQLAQNRARAEMAAMLPGETWAQRCMDTIFQQTIQVTEKVDNEGRPIVSARGFKMFGSKIKKDGAYARLYAYCGCMLPRGSRDFINDPRESRFFEPSLPARCMRCA
jgi:hypothetical protein